MPKTIAKLILLRMIQLGQTVTYDIKGRPIFKEQLIKMLNA
jgi:hypothetical protein